MMMSTNFLQSKGVGLRTRKLPTIMWNRAGGAIYPQVLEVAL